MAETLLEKINHISNFRVFLQPEPKGLHDFMIDEIEAYKRKRDLPCSADLRLDRSLADLA